MAGETGLEPAASGVTSRRYNQLNYSPAHKEYINLDKLSMERLIGSYWVSVNCLFKSGLFYFKKSWKTKNELKEVHFYGPHF